MSRNNIQISKHKLDNGLKILFYSYCCAPSATFMVWYKVGSRNEIAGKTGLSHFLEHLSFKRTELFDYGQIVSEINRNGGNFNAYTSRDFTCYYETFTTNKLEIAMIIESQRMHKLILNENDRQTEVGIILAELEKGLDNPYSELENAIRLETYKTHPYRYPIIGVADDVKNITIQDLQDYYDNFYKPNNATIVVVGNFDNNEAFRLIQKHFGSIHSGKTNTYVEKEDPQKHLRRTKVSKAGSYSIVKQAYHIPSCEHDDIFPLLVIGEMLNTGVSSRIHQELVEKQIATDISTNVEVTKDSGLFTIIATLFPNVSHNEAENRIFDEINNIYNHQSPTEEELENTKKRIKSSFEFNKDGTLKFAYLLGYYETINSYKFFENYIDNIQKVTLDDIKRVAKLYLTKENCTVGHFIPVHDQKRIISPVSDYKVVSEKKHGNTPLPIIIETKTKPYPVNFSKRITSNGIKVLVSPNKISDTVKLHGTIFAGNLYAGMVNPSLPFMCGGMMNRGTKNKSKLEIATDVESRGASVGISNVTESVNFSLSCIKEDFPYILSLLSEILTEPSFPEEEFDKMKNFYIAGVKQRKNNSDFLANMYFKRMIFPKSHPWYAFSHETQEKHIKNTDLEDIKGFYDSFYAPNNTIMTIAGNIEMDEAFNLVEKHFQHWTEKEIICPKIKPVKLQKEFKQQIVPVKNKTETKIIFGHYGNLTRNHPDYHKALIMNFILGGSGALSSRIGKKLREELGLVYSVSSGFTALLIPGGWSVRFGVDDNRVDVAVESLKEEISRFIDDGITDLELEYAKSYNVGAYPLRFSSNNGIAKTLLVNEFYGLGDDYINDYPEIISSITKNQIEETANNHLHPEKASLVLVRSI
ncbi:MAG TPA: hypothetical protein DDW90_09650 [Cyanobacteria bacterium UBA9971]|nr:hypothetical protein [Cyanobacteria bacterium UBA9971]